jgi:hypothetical protein
MMVSFVDAHRAQYGVELVCKMLPIAPSPTTSTSLDRPILHACHHGFVAMR